MRSYNIALFYFKNRNVLTLPLTWLGKVGMCQQCKWTCVQYCTMYTHATGTGHGLVAPLALCLGPPRKNSSKITPMAIYGIHPIKKSLKKIFSGVEKCLSCRGSGHAPRATSQIPGTAGSSVHYGSVMLL